MSLIEQQVGADDVRSPDPAKVVDPSKSTTGQREFRSVIATVATTIAVFGIYTVQGIPIARILGPVGRGEFGTSIFFPRDIFLWAGLLGGIEIVNSYASRGVSDEVSLKYSAARLGLASGLITALVAAVSALLMLLIFVPQKSYLVPMCLFCCLFVPLEHMHLTISAVDRGSRKYSSYNWNRLAMALAFPLLIFLVFLVFRTPLQALGMKILQTWPYLFSPSLAGAMVLMCVLFVLSRIIGLLPTLRGMDVIGMLRNFVAGKVEKDSVPAIPNARELLNEGRPYALSMIATELFERLDVLLIVLCALVDQSGQYFVAVPAAALLTIVPNALGVFTFNAGAGNRHVSIKQALGSMAGLLVLQAVAAAVFMLIIPWLIVLLYGERYQDAGVFALWLAPACAIKGYLQAVDGYLKGRGKPLTGVYARSLSILAMIACVYFAWGQLGLFSIPAAAFVGQALSMIVISTAVFLDVKQASLNAGRKDK